MRSTSDGSRFIPSNCLHAAWTRLRKRDATSSAASDVIVGRWKDGRLGTVRAVVFRVKEIVAAKPQSAGSYRPLALEIVKFF